MGTASENPLSSLPANVWTLSLQKPGHPGKGTGQQKPSPGQFPAHTTPLRAPKQLACSLVPPDCPVPALSFPIIVTWSLKHLLSEAFLDCVPDTLSDPPPGRDKGLPPRFPPPPTHTSQQF